MNSSLNTIAEIKQASRWLNEFARDVYSQTGEDGILAKALSLLPEQNHWCVEFGAWDGRHLSNSYNLVENDDYSVVLIEGNTRKFEKLRTEYPFKDRAVFVGQLVGWTREDGLDAILDRAQKEQPVPIDFDLLSVDVDGNDYHIWSALEKYRPKLVLIEFNPTASNRIDHVQPAKGECNQSNSPAALVRLGKSKGYELICVTGVNLLFVDARYYERFHIPDNSLEAMRDEDEVTKLFLGFDGSMVVDGPATLRWHKGREIRMPQPLPKTLRQYPPTYNRLQRLLYRWWRVAG